MAPQKWIWLVSMRTQAWSLASLSGLRVRHCCELQCRSQTCSDLACLWLWCRPAATAPVWPIAWELPCAMGASLKRPKKKERMLRCSERSRRYKWIPKRQGGRFGARSPIKILEALALEGRWCVCMFISLCVCVCVSLKLDRRKKLCEGETGLQGAHTRWT